MPDTPLKYPNIYQPKRPLYDEDGNRLWFRTYISKPKAKYDVYNLCNVICQTRLYQWARNEFKNGTPIAELHGYLFFDQPNVSKRHLGSTIRQAVPYDPGLLIGRRKDNPKACKAYVFQNPKDLEYGLEWMISIWLRKITFAESADDMEYELDELANAEEKDLPGLYWKPFMEPIIQESLVEFDWVNIWKQFDLTNQVVQRVQKDVKPPEKPRSLA